MAQLQITTVLGARPQFVKAAPLSRRLAASDDVGEMLLHTGQHYDPEMSDLFFEQLGLPEPGAHLGVGSASHGAQTGQMLELVEAALIESPPDLVIVYGDTNSTLAGALAAAKLRIPVAHVEAGLRSHNRDMPEEVNRVLTDHVADVLLCPSDLAVENLAAEGITSGVAMVGDLMRDALEWSLAAVEDEQAVLDRHSVTSGGFSLVTIHRPSNTDDAQRFGHIMSALELLGRDEPVLFPVHPRTRRALESGGFGGPVRLLPPLGHLELLVLAKHAGVGLTDSGGLQKELYWLETPAVTLRGETEWPETIAAGWNRLGGDTTDEIVKNAQAAAGERPDHPNLYGDGRAAEHVEEVLRGWQSSRT